MLEGVDTSPPAVCIQHLVEVQMKTQANMRLYCIVASPAMRGSTPLDVAASSVMDNNGLALALEEPDLDKVKLRLHAIKTGGS